MLDELTLLQTATEGQGLVFDAQCLQEKIAWFDQAQCTPAPRGDTPLYYVSCSDGYSGCAVYHGAKGVNESCAAPALPGDDLTLFAAIHLFSECAPGLFCDRGAQVCKYRCPVGVLGAGEPCLEAGVTNEQCEPPLVCDSLGSGTCVPLPAEGEACTHYFDMGVDCSSGLYCAPDGTCAPEVPTGSDCRWHGDCQSELCIPTSPTSGTCAEPTVAEAATTCYLVVE